MTSSVRWGRIDIVLVTILIIGGALRIWGISFGLPYMYHPDEGVPVNIALKILHTGDLNPKFFHWPSLLFYLNALVYYGYFIVGYLVGVFQSPSDLPYPDVVAMAVGKAALPAEFLLGRGLTAVVGTLTIIWVYLIARRITSSRSVGLCAALLLAVEPISIKHSQFVRPDTFAVFFALWAVFFALKIVDDPRLRNYVFAGIGIGLAISSKYNLALICVPVLVAHLLQFGFRGLFRREICLAGLASVVVFLVSTPFAVLDLPTFLQIGPLDAARIYSTGHPGAEGNSLQFYLSFLGVTQGWLLLLSAAGTVWVISKQERKGIILLSFVLTYFPFISSYTVHFDTTILPLISFLIILAAMFAIRGCDWIARRFSANRVLANTLFTGVTIALGFAPLSTSVANNVHLLQPDGREYARAWIDTNLPPGSRIAIESYSPYVDQGRFIVTGLYGIQDHEPDWYIANGFEYIVLSQGVYGRYFDDPIYYGAEVNRYNSLFAHFPEIARFDQNGFEIRIHKTGLLLPPHRVAARYGDNGGLVELVGYDDIEWKQGESLRLNLTWRTITEIPEPLEVEFRLINQADKEIAKAKSDLFQGNGWRQGVFDGSWTIPIPPDVVPGNYRVQVDVDWTRYAYRMPATDWAGGRVDPVLVGPVELKAK